MSVLKLSAFLAVVSLGFTVWCLVEAASTDESRIRTMPKVAWILMIVFLPLAGAVAWLLAGRPANTVTDAGAAPVKPISDRSRPATARELAKDEDYLRKVRERAEEQRRRYEQQKKDKPDADE